MKKILIILLALMLTGCNFIKIGKEENVGAPKNNKPPIEGKWTITKCIFSETKKIDNFKYKNLIGKDAVFSDKGVIIANIYSADPLFSVRKVDAATYLKQEYNFDKNKVGIEKENIYVIDIYNDHDFFYKIIKEREDLAYIIMNGVMVQINRISEKVAEREIKALLTAKDGSNPESVEVFNYSENGFLLGIKQPYLDSNTNLMNWTYKTIYLKFVENELIAYRKVDKIIFPRTNGFYEVNIERKVKGNNKNDLITINPLDMKKGYGNGINEMSVPVGNSLKNIEFISGECINIENIYTEENNKRDLKLYLIESTKLTSPTKLSDFVQNGSKIFLDSAKLKVPLEEEVVFDETNIGLRRERGYWRFFGRINFNKQEEELYKDFDLNIVTPKDLIKYDDLSFPSSEIKDKIPEVRDAFISPNNRFLITMEKDLLKIYNIVNGRIVLEPIEEIKIGEKSESVMTEWAIGNSAHTWEKEFIELTSE